MAQKLNRNKAKIHEAIELLGGRKIINIFGKKVGVRDKLERKSINTWLKGIQSLHSISIRVKLAAK